MDKDEKIILSFGICGILIGYYFFGIYGIAIGAQLVWLPWFYYVSKI